MRCVRLTTCLMVVLIASPVSAEGLDAVELSLFGSYLSNAYGSGSEADIQTTTVRLSSGDRLQLYVELPWLRIRSTGVVPGGGLGPIPIDPRRRGPGEATGHGPSGQGQGSGGSVPDTTPPVGVTAPALTDEWNAGAGDVRLGVGRRVVGGDAKLFRTDVELEVKVPTADEAEDLGTGELDMRVGVSGEYRFWSATAFAGVGFNRLGDPVWTDLNDVFDAIAGLESDPLGERMVVYGWMQANDEVADGAGSPVLAGLGLRSLGRVRWSARVTAGLSGPVEDLGATVGVSYGVDAWQAASRRSRR